MKKLSPFDEIRQNRRTTGNDKVWALACSDELLVKEFCFTFGRLPTRAEFDFLIEIRDIGYDHGYIEAYG